MARRKRRQRLLSAEVEYCDVEQGKRRTEYQKSENTEQKPTNDAAMEVHQ